MFVIIKSYLLLLLALTYGAAADDASPASRHVRKQQPRGLQRQSLELQEPSRRALKSKAPKGKDPFANVPSVDECLVVKKNYTIEAPKNVEFPGPSVFRFDGCGENPTTAAFLKCITKPIVGVTNQCAFYYQQDPLLTFDEIDAYGTCLSTYPGPTAPNPYLTQLLGCPGPTDDVNALNAYRSCIEQKGYAINGKWWFNRDQQGSSFRFASVTSGATTKDAACGKIYSPDTTDVPITSSSYQTGKLGLGKTKFELWDLNYLKRPVGEFVKFEVDYDILNLGTANGAGTVAFVNVYLLKNAASTSFYDCRLDFLVPNPTNTNVWQKLTIDSTTTTTSFAFKCGAINSIGAFLAAYPGAVFGVGNGEYYAFTLDTGGTKEDNSNLDVCWSAPTISFATDVSVTKFVPIMGV